MVEGGLLWGGERNEDGERAYRQDGIDRIGTEYWLQKGVRGKSGLTASGEW